MKRRTFLKAMAAVSAWQLLPLLGARGQPGAERIIVSLQLTGGNDGLNMLVPYTDRGYYRSRPSLAVKAENVLALDAGLGLHPGMSALAGSFQEGKLAIIQAVGYPRPSRSHFRSMEIWQTAQPDRIADTGWLGRYLDLGGRVQDQFAALNLDPALPKTLSGNKRDAVSVTGINEFAFRAVPKYPQLRQAQQKAFLDLNSGFKLDRPYVELLREAGAEAVRGSERMRAIVEKYQSNQTYPAGPLGSRLKFVCQLITGGLGSRAYNLGFEGFDTHTNQAGHQENLLRQLSQALAAFYADLRSHGMENQVLVVVFSEFGRRVSENGGKGTDHGTAGPVMILGGKVKGGIYGEAPELEDLSDGDLKHKIDFRSVYATILDGWLNADSKEILQARYDNLGFV